MRFATPPSRAQADASGWNRALYPERTRRSCLPHVKPADRGNDGRRARISFDRATRDAHGSGQLEPACETDLTRP